MPHCQDQVPGGGSDGKARSLGEGSDAKTREGPYQHLVPGGEGLTSRPGPWRWV